MSASSPQAQQAPAALWGLAAGFIAFLVILMLPAATGLPPAGHRMLAVLAFAVIVWITEAVSYEVSSVIIVAMIALLLGAAPKPGGTTAMGTTAALGMALGGFSNSALALVAAALVIAAAMTITGLDRRIALRTLSLVGTSTRGVLLGSIIVTIVLSFVVPSATARTACVVPIMLGIISAFGVDRRSKLAAGIMILVAQATSIWNVGILTSAAQNLLTIGFMRRQIQADVSWSQWLIAGAPWAIVMSVILYFVVLRLMPPEQDEIEGGQATVQAELARLGPMSGAEWRLLIVSLALLFTWSTEKTLHNADTATTTIVGLAVLFLPKVGVMTWKQAQARVPWGTVIVFGVGISLGTAILDSKAGAWLAGLVVNTFGLDQLGSLAVFAVLGAFLIIIHLGFASATALTASLLPILIAVLQKLPAGHNVLGITMLLGFTVSFGFMLPVNAPQNMVCLGTDTFTPSQFVRVGIPLTLIGYVLLLVFAATWWRMLGWI